MPRQATSSAAAPYRPCDGPPPVLPFFGNGSRHCTPVDMARLLLREDRMTPTLERVLDRLSMMRAGKFDLTWMHANSDGWGTSGTPSANGLNVHEITIVKHEIIAGLG